jgi:hypothetical protein
MVMVIPSLRSRPGAKMPFCLPTADCRLETFVKWFERTAIRDEWTAFLMGIP